MTGLSAEAAYHLIDPGRVWRYDRNPTERFIHSNSVSLVLKIGNMDSKLWELIEQCLETA